MTDDEGDGISLQTFFRECLALHMAAVEQRIEGLERLFITRIDGVELRAIERLEARQQAAFAMATAQEKAILKAELATEKRFEAVNEFRGALADMCARQITRAEAMTRFEALDAHLDQIATRLNLSDGAGQGMRSFWMVLIGLISSVGAVIAIIVAIASFGGAP